MSRAKDITKTNLKLLPYQVILRPIVTEKGMKTSEENNIYTFEVHQLAGKQQIKEAVEELFDVKVLFVNTQNRKGKPKRHGRSTGYTKSWKKAFVKLDVESRIDFI
ncbi:MAG: 50S ribosomal protein L23 [Planctomycetaceae bacterium]|jgi:large subunit ribosomal protein L23|nr:50S ribosomal protein L23 [Planctomycetaceae bacterium]